MSKDKMEKHAQKLCKCGNIVCECAQKKLKHKQDESSLAISLSEKHDSGKHSFAVKSETQKAPVSHPREVILAMRLEKTVEALKDKGYVVSVVGDVKAAADLVMEEILPARKGNLVSFGGSTTVVESGLYDRLKNAPDIAVLDTNDRTVALDVMIERRRQALLSDLFITSVNALTQDGKLLWLDGICNRTAAVQFGPKQVVLLVGRNKICADVEAGIERIKTLAAPANVVRLNRKTPCAKTGYCMDCKSPESVCTAWTLMRRCSPVGRIHLVLINEDLGF